MMCALDDSEDDFMTGSSCPSRASNDRNDIHHLCLLLSLQVSLSTEAVYVLTLKEIMNKTSNWTPPPRHHHSTGWAIHPGSWVEPKEEPPAAVDNTAAVPLQEV